MLVKFRPSRIKIKGYKRNDCSINALGSALGISYDLARKVLQTAVYVKKGEISFLKKRPRTKSELSSKRNVIQVCEAICEDRAVFTAPKSKACSSRRAKHLGHRDNSVGKFAKSNASGIFILLTDTHMLTVIDGKVIDTWDSTDLVVEIAYRVNIDKARQSIANLAKFYKLASESHMIETF